MGSLGFLLLKHTRHELGVVDTLVFDGKGLHIVLSLFFEVLLLRRLLLVEFKLLNWLLSRFLLSIIGSIFIKESIEVSRILLPEVIDFSFALLIGDLAFLIFALDLNSLRLDECGIELAVVAHHLLHFWRSSVWVNLLHDRFFWFVFGSRKEVIVLPFHHLLLPLTLFLYLFLLLPL